MAASTDKFHVFETTFGFAAITWSDRGVAALRLPDRSPELAERALLRRSPHAKPGAPSHDVSSVIGDIRRYFEGNYVSFAEVPVELTEADPFLSRVYAAVRGVGWGETTSYGAIAKQLGTGPERARDVGRAMARNPVPLIIPCHRVLAAGGRIGGFSAPGGVHSKGGVHLKARMLALEGVSPASIGVVAAPVQEAFEF